MSKEKDRLFRTSVVAIQRDARGRSAYCGGARAKECWAVPRVHLCHPAHEGRVIADFEITGEMLRYFIAKCTIAGLLRPRVVISIPSGITPVEKRPFGIGQSAGLARSISSRNRWLRQSERASHHRGFREHDCRYWRRTTEVAVISLSGSSQ